MKDKIEAFLARYIRKYDLGDDEDIFALGLVNSLFAMQLVLFLEKEFSIKIDNNDLNIDNFRTLNKMVSFVEGKVNL